MGGERQRGLVGGMSELDDDDAARQAEEVLRHALDLVSERCNFTPLDEVAARLGIELDPPPDETVYDPGPP